MPKVAFLLVCEATISTERRLWIALLSFLRSIVAR
jgi:hypothetical protein